MKKRTLCLILAAIMVLAAFAGCAEKEKEQAPGVSASVEKDGVTYSVNDLRQIKQKNGKYKITLDVDFKYTKQVEFASPIILAADKDFEKTIKITRSSMTDGVFSIEASADEKLETLYIKMPVPIEVVDGEVTAQYIPAESAGYNKDETGKAVTHMTLVFDAQKLPVTPRAISIKSGVLDGEVIDCASSTVTRDRDMKPVTCEFTFDVPEGYSYEQDPGAELLLAGDFKLLEPAELEIALG